MFESGQDVYKQQVQALESMDSLQQEAPAGLMGGSQTEVYSYVNDFVNYLRSRRSDIEVPEIETKPSALPEISDVDVAEFEAAVAGMSPQYQREMAEGLEQAAAMRAASGIEVKDVKDTDEGKLSNPESLEVEQDTIDVSPAAEAPDQIGLMTKQPKEESSDQEATALPKIVISDGTRAEYKPTSDMFNLSLDFNSFKGGKGTEVIIPDNADKATREAAERFNQLVVDFAAKHGYKDYRNRGVKTRKQNKRGVRNTIHVEPFFAQDAAMEKIVKDNMAEFAKLYTEAFGNLNVRMVKPHGKTNSKGVLDRGAVSETFGDELAFGQLIIDNLKN